MAEPKAATDTSVAMNELPESAESTASDKSAAPLEGQGKAADTDEILSHPKVQEFVKGLRQNKDDILREKKEIEGALKEMQSRMGALDSLGGETAIAKLLELKTQLDQDEHAKLLAKGDIETYNAKIISGVRKDMESQIAARDQKIQELQNQGEAQQNKMNQLIIESRVEAAITKTEGLDKSASPLIKMLVKDKFKVNPETGQPEARVNGELEFGRDGKPLQPEEWIQTTLGQDYPLFFRGESGIGSPASSGNGADTQIRATREQLSNIHNYNKLKEEAIKRGKPWPPPDGFKYD